jgi:predicted nucleotidyltransferase
VIITSQKLIDLAAEHVEHRRAGGSLLAAYLVGSVVSGDPLLGGTADIDLVLVHRQPQSIAREFLTLSRDVHLDVVHHEMERYAQPRRLRLDPWLGPSVREARVLHDPEHFFDWAVAGARGQFERADAVTARANALLAASHQDAASAARAPAWQGEYLRALLAACNAAVALVAPPACGRRTSAVLETRLALLGDSTLFDAYRSLHGALALTPDDVALAISCWARAAEVIVARPTQDLPAARAAYWLSGLRALAESGRPDHAVWPLFFTWETTLAGSGALDPRLEAEMAPIFERAALDEPQRADRLLALEAFTDRVEGLVQAWAGRHGA